MVDPHPILLMLEAGSLEVGLGDKFFREGWLVV
jgi:hypothetical protein